MSLNFKKSVLADLDLIEKIELQCFSDFQRSPRRALRLSITSSFQGVWLANLKKGNKKIPVGMIVYNFYPKTLRIYSIAVLPEFQGQGFGKELLSHAYEMAINANYEKISLEASATDEKLIAFYTKAGFIETEKLPDYYENGKDAIRMVLKISDPQEKSLSPIL